MAEERPEVATRGDGWAALISERPDDPAEREAWAKGLMRIQVAMWVDKGAACQHCQHPYADVDDFLARQPRYAGDGPAFVDSACWDAWLAARETGDGR